MSKGGGSRDDLQQRAEALENLREALDELMARTTSYETTLEDLSQRRDEVAGRLDLARRQAADFENQLVAKEAELEETRKLVAYQALKEAVKSRDDAATHAASAIDEVIAALELLGGLQDAVAAAGRAVSPGFDVSSVEPPDVIESAWRRLVEYVRSRIEERLQDEAVEAAARSFQGYEINKLPEHLQALARQVRADLTKNGGGGVR